jgi:hypothetical protein
MGLIPRKSKGESWSLSDNGTTVIDIDLFVVGCCSMLSRAIDALPTTLDKILDEVQNQTGLVGSVFLVGPEPQQGGDDIVIM